MSSKYEEYENHIVRPFQRLSYAKKKAYDFKWAEKCADFYDNYYNQYYDQERIQRLKENYNLYNGKGTIKFSEDFGYNIQDEGFDPSYADAQHHNIIDQIAKTMVGEQQRRNLTPIAIDSSNYATNIRKVERNRLYQRYIQEKLIAPIEQKALQEVMQQLGIEDVYSLNPDEQMEFSKMVKEQAAAMTPEEIDRYMRNDYKSPSEIQAQKLVDYLMSEYDLKYLTDEGFKHAIITGEEIYYVGVRHNNPHVELVNPLGFTAIGSNNTHWIEQGEAAKYEQYIKYTDLFNKFGDVMTKKDLKKLESPLSLEGSQRGSLDRDARLVAEISAIDSEMGGKLFDNAPDIRTKDGQDFIKHIYSKYGSDHDGYSSVRHVHIVWKSLRKLLYITRDTDQGVKNFWVDESYKFNKAKGDVKQQIVWVPEVWECDKIGTIDSLYFNKRPIRFQYSSLHDPWNVKLPYVGVQYSKLFNNTQNVSPIDLGKKWQYKFNIQMAKIHEMEATDVGKVLLTTMNAKPKDWSWGKWISMMKYGKIAPIDTQSEGFNPGIDSQIFKSIDLSTLSDIAGRLQYLEFIKNQAALAMSYNPNRLGQVAPHTAVSNNQQNIVQSSYQTEDIYSTHNKVVENLLNALVKQTRIAFKDNEFSRTYLLDDMSRAELELDTEILDRSKIGIKIRNSSEDFYNINQVKQLGQAMIQNGLISFPELIKLLWANNGAEVLNIAEYAEEKAEKMRQMQSQEQERMMQMQNQMQKEMEEIKRQFELEKQSREHEKDILINQIAAGRYARQYDINENQINDQYETKLIELAHEKEENEKDREHELKLAKEKAKEKKTSK